MPVFNMKPPKKKEAKKPAKKKNVSMGMGCTHISPEEAKRPPRKGRKK